MNFLVISPSHKDKNPSFLFLNYNQIVEINIQANQKEGRIVDVNGKEYILTENQAKQLLEQLQRSMGYKIDLMNKFSEKKRERSFF